MVPSIRPNVFEEDDEDDGDDEDKPPGSGSRALRNIDVTDVRVC